MNRAPLSRQLGYWSFCVVLVMTLVATGVSSAQAPAAAPTYKTDTVTPGFETPAKGFNHTMVGEIRPVLQAPNPPAAGTEGLFDEYFGKVLYPTLTQNFMVQTPIKDDRTPTTFPRIVRTQVKPRFFNPASDPETLKLLNKVTLSKMSEYVNENFHPVIRFNAMLVIAELLNDNLLKDPKVKPSVDALPVLVRSAGDPKLPGAVRIAALIGIKRHAEAPGIKDEHKKLILDAMAKLIADKTVSGDATEESAAWQRMRAAEVASILGVNTPEVKALLAPPVAAAKGAPAPATLPGAPAMPAPPAGADKSPFDN